MYFGRDFHREPYIESSNDFDYELLWNKPQIFVKSVFVHCSVGGSFCFANVSSNFIVIALSYTDESCLF